MHAIIKPAIALLVLAALGVACRANLPLNEPPRPTADGSPQLRTNDGPAGPLTDEGLSSPPDTTGGTNSLPIPTPGGGGGTGSVAP